MFIRDTKLPVKGTVLPRTLRTKSGLVTLRFSPSLTRILTMILTQNMQDIILWPTYDDLMCYSVALVLRVAQSHLNDLVQGETLCLSSDIPALGSIRKILSIARQVLKA